MNRLAWEELKEEIALILSDMMNVDPIKRENPKDFRKRALEAWKIGYKKIILTMALAELNFFKELEMTYYKMINDEAYSESKEQED